MKAFLTLALLATVACVDKPSKERLGKSISVGKNGEWNIKGDDSFFYLINEMRKLNENGTGKPIFVIFYDKEISKKDDFEKLLKCISDEAKDFVQVIRTNIPEIFPIESDSEMLGKFKPGSLSLVASIKDRRSNKDGVSQFSSITQGKVWPHLDEKDFETELNGVIGEIKELGEETITGDDDSSSGRRARRWWGLGCGSGLGWGWGLGWGYPFYGGLWW